MLIALDLEKQRLHTVTCYFMDSKAHKTKVLSIAGQENVQSDSVVEMELEEAQKIEFVNNTSAGTFKIKK